MLTDLIIRNFAIIDRLHVSFGPGFNVLTGETGAGKSIVIDAVGLLLGARARPEFIRNGEEEATGEAVLDLGASPGVRAEIVAAGFGDGDEMLVKRIISRSGKNRIFINGSLATLGQLQPLTSQLLTIYGQHEHQSLQRTETHMALLDGWAGLRPDLEAYRRCFEEVDELEARRRGLDEAERQRRQRLDLLSFQSREISAARLHPGEDDELTAERLLLQHSERLVAAVNGGYDSIYGAEGAVCERLAVTAFELEELAKIDPRLGLMAETIRNSQYALEETASELRTLGGGISFEPDRQNEVEERLALIVSLKRKYAPSIEGILAYGEEIDREIGELEDIESTREALTDKIRAKKAEMLELGTKISDRRGEAAQELQLAVEGELKDLAMGRARFEVRLAPLAEPGPRGLERAEFLIAPNPGEEPKPLARIASGGELSRIMLALRRAAPEGDGGATLIFDEVDAGIGGIAASAVGEKLRGVAKGFQVLCITHLPQVAAFADRHFRVEKRVEGERTFTSLVQLDEEERVLEMARMLGGARLTDRSMEHARELIRLSAGG
ncbi:MAG: DNA repair protein RecN [Desulfuromonadales bacterium]